MTNCTVATEHSNYYRMSNLERSAISVLQECRIIHLYILIYSPVFHRFAKAVTKIYFWEVLGTTQRGLKPERTRDGGVLGREWRAPFPSTRSLGIAVSFPSEVPG